MAPLLHLPFLLTLALATQAPAPLPAPPLPSVALPPELDRVLRDYERAWSSRDLDALAALFAPDGMALPNGAPPAPGPAAIRKAYGRGAGSPLALRAYAYASSGDLAYILGAFAQSAAQADLGKFVLVLRRGPGGRWLIAADMDNALPQPRDRP